MPKVVEKLGIENLWRNNEKKDLKREKWGKRHCIEREGKRGNNRRVKWLREAHRKKII